MRESKFRLYEERVKEALLEFLKRNKSKVILAKEVGLDQMTLDKYFERVLESEEYKKYVEQYEIIKGINKKSGASYRKSTKEKKERIRELRDDKTQVERNDFLKFSKEEKIECIIRKVNKRKAFTKGEKIQRDEEIRKDIEEITRYFLEYRNSVISDPKNGFDENAVLLLIFEHQKVIDPSEKKIEKLFKYWDNHPRIGPDAANNIIRGHPAIVTSNVQETINKFEMVDDLDVLDKFLRRSKCFIPPIETIYALIMYAKIDRELDMLTATAKQIVMDRKPLAAPKYKTTYEDLREKYKMPDKYKIKQPEKLEELDFKTRMKVNLPKTAGSKERTVGIQKPEIYLGEEG